eukprot:11016388-Lingulodinium_polyedra.AAC.1
MTSSPPALCCPRHEALPERNRLGPFADGRRPTAVLVSARQEDAATQTLLPAVQRPWSAWLGAIWLL